MTYDSIITLEKYHHNLEHNLEHNPEHNREQKSISTPPRYRDFFYNHTLPYLDRNGFKRLWAGKCDGLVTEFFILEQLLVEDVYGGCMIYGESGAGKTRFMMELAAMAANMTWNVLVVTPALTDLSLLESHFEPENLYLLVFDDIEAHPLIDTGILEKLQDISGEAVVKILATCGDDGFNEAGWKENEHFLGVAAGTGGNEMEMTYRDAVNRHILGLAPRKNRAKKNLYQLKPALTVFIRYMNETGKEKDLPTKIRNAGDFRGYVEKRLECTFDDDIDALHENRPEIFYMFAVLPARGKALKHLTGNHEHLLESLKSKGWLEETACGDGGRRDSTLSVVHEAAADEILASRLERMSGAPLTKEIDDILVFAAVNDSFGTGYRAVERILGRSGLEREPGNKDGNKDIISENVISALCVHDYTETGCVKSSFEAPAVKLEIAVRQMGRDMALFGKTVGRLDFAYTLSYWMRHLARKCPPVSRGDGNEAKPRDYSAIGSEVLEYVGALFDKWYSRHMNFLIHKTISLMILPAYLSLFGRTRLMGLGGESPDDFTKWCMREYSADVECGYIISAWLDDGGDPGEVRPYVEEWLKANSLEKEASFVLKSWLDAGGERDAIYPYIRDWLPKRLYTGESCYVIQSWLTSGGSPDAVQPYVKKWLKIHRGKTQAAFIFETWLTNGGAPAVVQPQLEEYIEKSPVKWDTGFVFQRWLENGGSPEAIKPHAEKWLQKHGEVKEASFLLRSLLKAGDVDGMTESFALQWLETFSTSVEAHFILEAWLNGGGSPGTVEPYVRNWFNAFPGGLEGNFIIRAWLDRNGSYETIKPFIEGWFERFPLESDTVFVLYAWLDNGGAHDKIRPHVETWLGKHLDNVKAAYLFKAWLNNNGPHDVIRPFIDRWLKAFPLEQETQFVFQAWLNSGGSHTEMWPHIETWLDKHPYNIKTSYLLQAWLDSGGSIQLIQTFIKKWFDKNSVTTGTGFVVKSWLSGGGSAEVIQSYLLEWLRANPGTRDTSYMLQTWLDSGAPSRAVRSHVEQWLNDHLYVKENSFLIHSWLRNGGDTGTVKPFIKPWLERFPFEREDTSYVIKAWLLAEGEISEVTPYIFQWLDIHGDTFEASFIIKAWLKNTGDRETIQAYANRWLRVNWESRDADFVIKRFCASPDTPADVYDFAVRWCRKYPRYRQAIPILKVLTRHQREDSSIIGPWLLDMLSYWMDKDDLSEFHMRDLEVIMYSLSKYKSFLKLPGRREVYIKWFLSPKSFRSMTLEDRYLFMQAASYATRYFSLLEKGDLEVSACRTEAKKFLDWLKGWKPERIRLLIPSMDTLEKKLDASAGV